MGCRKNQANLTAAERAAFINAVIALKNSVPSQMGLTSRYDDYVQTHMNAMMAQTQTQVGWAHRGPAFLPWHREFLRRFELDLQAIDPSVTIPYWDWTTDNSPDPSVSGSPWTSDFMGGNGRASDGIVIDGPFAHSTGRWNLNLNDDPTMGPELKRRFGTFPRVSILPTATQVTDALTVVPYDTSPWQDYQVFSDSSTPSVQPSFRNRLEGWYGAGSIHNRVHLWVGGGNPSTGNSNDLGTMVFMTSLNDPIFWLHHCNIDRLWALWQQQHLAEGYHPTGAGGEVGPTGHNLNDVMIFNGMGQPAPWTVTATPASVLDHQTLGYLYDIDPAQVILTTPSIDFGGVPEGVGGSGVTTYRAIKFEVMSCSPVTLQIIPPGPTAGFSAPALSSPVPVNQPPLAGLAPNFGRLWIAYTSTTPGSSITGSVTVQAVDSGTGTVFGPWVVNLAAHTIPRPKSAVMLVLDRSGSMVIDAGNGHQRVELLRTAVSTFVDVMQQGDGLGIVRFDNLVDTLMGVTDVGPMPIVPGSGRDQAQQIVASHDPATTLDPRGSTSIGGGIQQAKTALDAASQTYTVRAMVVLTDGLENTPPMIADVSSSLTANTFAIGFGQAASISTAALNAITQGHGGYLVITGPITPDETFALTEYFLKIQAGVNNSTAVLDPRGELIYGVTHRIPFTLTNADMGLDVILLSPAPYYIDFRLQTPDGKVIDPSMAGVEPAIQFISTRRVSYYRASLPMIASDAAGSHAGQWYVLLGLSDKARGVDAEFMKELRSSSLPYSLLVHAYSNLQFKPSVLQKSFEPGAEVKVLAALNQYDVPLEKHASVWAEIKCPDGTEVILALPETDAGRFGAGFIASLTGVYTVRVRVQGTTLEGQNFQREQRLTAVVFPGGDQPPSQGGGDRLCKLLSCLLRDGVLHEEFAKRLATQGINIKALKECLKIYCREVQADLGGEHEYTPSGAEPQIVPGFTMSQFLEQPEVRRAISEIQRELKAAEGMPGFAKLKEGEQIHREIEQVRDMPPGPMFGLSPEDKVADEGGQIGEQVTGESVVMRPPRPMFDLSPEDKAGGENVEESKQGSEHEQSKKTYEKRHRRLKDPS